MQVMSGFTMHVEMLTIVRGLFKMLRGGLKINNYFAPTCKKLQASQGNAQPEAGQANLSVIIQFYCAYIKRQIRSLNIQTGIC